MGDEARRMREMDQNARQLRRRLRAARELAGFEHVQDLADKIGEERGFSRDTLYSWEQGRYNRPPGSSKLTRVAEACGLDVAWFYVDIKLAVQRAGGGLPASELERRLREDQRKREDQQPPDSEEEGDSDAGSDG